MSASVGALVSTETATHIAYLQPLRYAGYVYDEATGLYLTGARAYDSKTAQFLSKDPARADGEQSAYQYCGGDPVGMVDPSGEWGKKVHYHMTKGWVNGIMPLYAMRIAAADNFVDDPESGLKGGHIRSREKHHGYTNATASKVKWFNIAVGAWRDGKKTKAIKYFGWALHTLQDIYAHRRKDFDGDARHYEADYGNETGGYQHFGHDDQYQDDWGGTKPELRAKVARVSKNLIARFKRRKKL